MGAVHPQPLWAFASLFHHYSHDSRRPNLPEWAVRVHRLIYCGFWPGAGTPRPLNSRLCGTAPEPRGGQQRLGQPNHDCTRPTFQTASVTVMLLSPPWNAGCFGVGEILSDGALMARVSDSQSGGGTKGFQRQHANPPVCRRTQPKQKRTEKSNIPDPASNLAPERPHRLLFRTTATAAWNKSPCVTTRPPSL